MKLPPLLIEKPVRNFDLEKVPEDDADEPADLEGMPKQWKGSVLTESTELFRDLGSSGEVALTSSNSELHNSRRDDYVDSFPKDPVKCSQDSSILEPTELDEFNNIQRTQAMEAITLTYPDVSRSSASSTLTVSEIKHTASNSHSNGDHGNTTSLEKIPVVTVGNQNKKGKPALSEECESLAAEILLSFAPSNKSQADTERHSSESAKSNGDLPTTDEKPDLCQKKMC
ncbi:hypothetical protein OIU78_023400 [Salix suchowensis]|nr:hypothetical protein OIU78_023400 [Salix suchowensis]